jgi:hypothetical protein
MGGWQTMDTAHGAGPVVLGRNGDVTYTMTFRLPGWFKKCGFPEQPSGAWTVQGCGLLAYNKDGTPMIVTPSEWRELPK